MATSAPKHPPDLRESNSPLCDKHSVPIDITCGDCSEFICTTCAKTDHKYHDWETISTAATLRKRELKTYLCKVKVEDLQEIDVKIQKTFTQMEYNKKLCDSELLNLQKHYDEIVSKLDEIKMNYEKTLRGNLERKNAEESKKNTELEEQKTLVINLIKVLEEDQNIRTMSDFCLLNNLGNLNKLLSNREQNTQTHDLSVRYRKGHIGEGSLESLMGETFDLDDINIIITERDSFQYENTPIAVLEVMNNNSWFVKFLKSEYIGQFYKWTEKTKKFNIIANDICVLDNGKVYATDVVNSIACLSPSGSVSTAFNTASLMPGGICQAIDGEMMITLIDRESKRYQPDSRSRRLVRHVTLTGDIIREYEYQEDGQTRLFIQPTRVKQNGNTDICVVNRTSNSTGELVILSSSGILKTVYQGQHIAENFLPTKVECDLYCNIIVNDVNNSKINLLSPDGKFMQYILTENEVTRPLSMCLYESSLWVGNCHGLVKIFSYNPI